MNTKSNSTQPTGLNRSGLNKIIHSLFAFIRTSILTTIIATTLVACGGGEDDDGSSPNPPASIFNGLHSSTNVTDTIDVSSASNIPILANFSTSLRVANTGLADNTTTLDILEVAQIQVAPLTIEYSLVKEGDTSYKCFKTIPDPQVAVTNNTNIVFTLDIGSILTDDCITRGGEESRITPVGYAASFVPFDFIENIRIADISITIQNNTNKNFNRKHSLGSIGIAGRITLTGDSAPDYSYIVSSPTISVSRADIGDDVPDEIIAEFSLSVRDTNNSVSLSGVSLNLNDASITYNLLQTGAVHRCNRQIANGDITASPGANNNLLFQVDISFISNATCNLDSSIRPLGFQEGEAQEGELLERIEAISINGINFIIIDSTLARLKNSSHRLEDVGFGSASITLTGTRNSDFSYVTDTTTPITDVVFTLSSDGYPPSPNELITNLVVSIRNKGNATEIFDLEAAVVSINSVRIEYNLTQGNAPNTCVMPIDSDQVSPTVNANDIAFEIALTTVLTSSCQPSGATSSGITPIGYSDSPFDRIDSIRITELFFTISEASNPALNTLHILAGIELVDGVITLSGNAVPDYSYSVSGANEGERRIDISTNQVEVDFTVVISDFGNPVNLDGVVVSIDDGEGGVMVNYDLLNDGETNVCNANIPASELSNIISNNEILFSLNVASILTAECLPAAVTPVGYTADFQPFDEISITNISGVSFNITSASNDRLDGSEHALADISLANSFELFGARELSYSYVYSAKDFPSISLDVTDPANVADVPISFVLDIKESANLTETIELADADVGGTGVVASLVNDPTITYNLIQANQVNICESSLPSENVAITINAMNQLVFNLNVNSIATAVCQTRGQPNGVTPVGYISRFAPLDRINSFSISNLNIIIDGAVNPHFNVRYSLDAIEFANGELTLTGDVAQRLPVFPQATYNHFIDANMPPAADGLLFGLNGFHTDNYSITPAIGDNSLFSFNTTTGEFRYIAAEDVPIQTERISLFYEVAAISDVGTTTAQVEISIGETLRFAETSYVINTSRGVKGVIGEPLSLMLDDLNLDDYTIELIATDGNDYATGIFSIVEDPHSSNLRVQADRALGRGATPTFRSIDELPNYTLAINITSKIYPNDNSITDLLINVDDLYYIFNMPYPRNVTSVISGYQTLAHLNSFYNRAYNITYKILYDSSDGGFRLNKPPISMTDSVRNATYTEVLMTDAVSAAAEEHFVIIQELIQSRENIDPVIYYGPNNGTMILLHMLEGRKINADGINQPLIWRAQEGLTASFEEIAMLDLKIGDNIYEYCPDARVEALPTSTTSYFVNATQARECRVASIDTTSAPFDLPKRITFCPASASAEDFGRTAYRLETFIIPIQEPSVRLDSSSGFENNNDGVYLTTFNPVGRHRFSSSGAAISNEGWLGNPIVLPSTQTNTACEELGMRIQMVVR